MGSLARVLSAPCSQTDSVKCKFILSFPGDLAGRAGIDVKQAGQRSFLLLLPRSRDYTSGA